MDQFRVSVDRVDVAESARLYPLLKKSDLPVMMMRKFVRSLAEFEFKGKEIKFQRQAVLESILATAKQVVSDIKVNRLSCDPLLIDAALKLFRNMGRADEFTALFEWARSQGSGSDYCDLQVYGRAIDFFVKNSKTHQLPDLEALYQEALLTTHGTSPFAPYHLSHNAKLHDRDVQFPMLTTDALGIMLEEIIAARMAFGDWRAAYLGLDTYMRLNFEKPLKWGKLIQHRPCLEGYTLCRMSHQSNQMTGARPIHRVVHHLSISKTEAIENPVILRKRVADVCKSIDLLARHAELTGKLADSHVASVLASLKRMARLAKVPGEDAERENFAKKIVDWSERIFESAKDVLSSGDRVSRNILIEMSRTMDNPDLFSRLIGDLEPPHLARTDTLRQVILSAASFNDLDLAKKSWLELSKRTELSDVDRYIIQAALGGHVTERVDEFRVGQPRSLIDDYMPMAPRPYVRISNFTQRDFDHPDIAPRLSLAIEDFCARVKAVPKATSRDRANGRRLLQVKSTLEPTSTTLYLEDRPLGTIGDLWRIYDEVSTDPEAPNNAGDAQTTDTFSKGESSASTAVEQITLQNLDRFPNAKRRFDYWVKITELMAMAERAECEDVDEDLGSTDPRYTDFKELREYVFRLRNIPL
jgi:hypothetical protein